MKPLSSLVAVTLERVSTAVPLSSVITWLWEEEPPVWAMRLTSGGAAGQTCLSGVSTDCGACWQAGGALSGAGGGVLPGLFTTLP